MKKIVVLLLPFFLISCTTPSRLGISYKGELIQAASHSSLNNPNINVNVNSLTKEDNFNDIRLVNGKLILSVNKNESLTKITKIYPDAEIQLEITPSEDIKRTWILDALFFYPCSGYFPISPWWGTTDIQAVLTLGETTLERTYNFDFSSSEDFLIITYPYYRAGRIMSEKYSVAYDKLFKQISNYDFCKTYASLCDESAQPAKYVVMKPTGAFCDVDINIPVTNIKNDNAFIVIIGNENYSNEIDVTFAKNDANILSAYAKKTLGIPDRNVHTILDATYGQMLNEIDWINSVAKAYNGDAKLFFYYAGHGVPNEGDRSAYLLPVDGKSTNTATAIKLEYLYDKLAEHKTQSTTVFFDACFSGGSREGMLVKGRGVKIKPKMEAVEGNMIVFSSSTGDETALPFDEMQHGLFTYYLLKKLQDTKGDVTYGELFEYVSTNVAKQSVVNGKPQNPQVNCNIQIKEIWDDWKLK